MNRSAFGLEFLLSLMTLTSIGLMSYFGLPNPVTTGLHGSLGLAFLVLAFILSMRFLSGTVAALWLSLVLGGILMVTFANWWHYQFFRVYFNYQFIPFVRDGGGALHSIAQFDYWWPIGILALLFLLILPAFFAWRRCSPKSGFLGCRIAVVLLLGFLLLHSSYSQIARLRAANALTLSPYYFHPVQAFFYSLRGDSSNERDKWLAFRHKNRIEDKGAFLPAALGQKKYNILVLTMESFRASFIGAYNPVSKLTPNFDRIAKQGVLVENFYANANYTIKGENAIICGIFDHNAKLSIAEYDGEKHLNCLPKILEHNGYTTHYLHANHGKFYNRSNYIPELKFQDIYFHADHFPKREDGRTYIGWGLSDKNFFSLALKRLESKGGKPFYAQLMSLSNHYPFDYRWPISVPNDLSNIKSSTQKVYAGYENAIHYSDYALGAFWREFMHSPLSKNTIVVITGDHGVWSFDGGKAQDQLLRNEEYFRVPLFIYHPQIKRGYRIDQVASQVDIPVTLLDLVGANYPSEQFVGKDVFDRVAEPWAVMMKGGEVSVREKNEICLPRQPVCGGGAYQSCWSDAGVANFIDQFGRGQCYRYQGDLLNGGKGIPEKSSDIVLLDGIGMISYENARVLSAEKSMLAPSPFSENPEHAGTAGL